jgi:hypothetical protein
MSQIDFLPDKYRQRDVHRKNRWSRAVVVFIFVGLLAVGSLALRKKHSAVTAELELARQSYESMISQSATLAKAAAQLSEARSQANLIAFLRHPWSRARIVADLVASWPESLVLQELRVQRETGRAGQVHLSSVASPAASPSTKTAAQADLDELRQGLHDRPAVVLLTGSMTDQAVLHRYLAELTKSELFTNVELLGVAPADKRGGLRFNVRLSLLPGYGQTGGPSGPRPNAGAKEHEAAAAAREAAKAMPRAPLAAPDAGLFKPPRFAIHSPSAVEADGQNDTGTTHETSADGEGLEQGNFAQDDFAEDDFERDLGRDSDEEVDDRPRDDEAEEIAP